MKEGFEGGFSNPPEENAAGADTIDASAEAIGAEAESDLEALMNESIFYGELSGHIGDAFRKYQKDLAMSMPVRDFVEFLKAKKDELIRNVGDEEALNEGFFLSVVASNVEDVLARDGENAGLSEDMELEDFVKHLDSKNVLAA